MKTFSYLALAAAQHQKNTASLALGVNRALTTVTICIIYISFYLINKYGLPVRCNNNIYGFNIIYLIVQLVDFRQFHYSSIFFKLRL